MLARYVVEHSALLVARPRITTSSFNESASTFYKAMGRNAIAFPQPAARGFSKLNPREFIGGFESLVITAPA
jgi:hypothetical protein